jgi:glycosyltransferase involved in cell wall biosynthesis
MTVERHDMRAVVVQLGGRRQYAVPAALARAQCLEALYTDLCAGQGLGRLSPLLRLVPQLARRVDLSNRRPPPEVLSHTRTFPSWFFDMQRALKAGHDPIERIRSLRAAHERASAKMIAAGFGEATHVLAMFGEGVAYQRRAREKGMTVAVDVNVAPSTEAIVRREQALHPGWEPASLYYGETLPKGAETSRPMEAILAATDRFLCPSEFVRDDLITNFGVAPANARLVPYAVNPKWFDVDPVPEAGRILFAGGAGLRKGIHVLAQAARILRERGRPYRFLVAGAASETIRGRPETSALEFLGRLPPSAMREQFARADLLAFPSLAEGSAGVTYEALGSALPVVTTHEAGSVVRHGMDGLIVPSRDAEALAQAIDTIVGDRDLRDRMSVSARVHARRFGWDSFESRLLEALFAEATQEKRAANE